jgi:hypothetical protein
MCPTPKGRPDELPKRRVRLDYLDAQKSGVFHQ